MKKANDSTSHALLKDFHNEERQPLVRVHRRYRKARVCVGSKAAVAVLFWSFAVSIAYILLLHKHTVAIVVLESYSEVFVLITISGYAALIQLIFPLAGYLADTKFGRYRTIHFSLWILELVLLCIGTAGVLTYFYKSHITRVVSTGVIYFACLIFTIGLPGFNANVIQFGLDQLFHTPSEDQSLFIQWYVWGYYCSGLIVDIVLSSEILAKSNIIPFTLLAVPLFIITPLLLLSLYLFYRQKKWFLIVPKYRNPYALVYKVTKFSRKHKVPLNRSAFTYCEDDIPCGLDLGKDKYGGPFTTEQVEDVKAFFGVLKIICSLGPALFIHIAERHITPLFSGHFTSYVDMGQEGNISATSTNATINTILGNGTFYSLVAFIIFPLYICVIRPLVRDRIPGMLRRMGIGICVSLLSIVTSLAVDTTIHLDDRNTGCVFTTLPQHNTTVSYTQRSQIPAKVLLVVQQIFSAVSHTVFYVAVYEFICSQSPHSMKGFLLGIFYATRGLYEILGSLLLVPFALDKYGLLLPSCGMVYYLVNITIGVAALLIYIYTARNYKFRVRDEVCPVRRYVEEYYSKLPKKNNCD